MKAFVVRCLAIAAFAFAFAAPSFAEEATPAVDPARMAAARDLMEVTGVTKQLDSMMDVMQAQFAANAKQAGASEKASEDFKATLSKILLFKDEMINDFAVLYAETFTAEEMKTVADFYRSGTGAKFIALTPELMKKGAVIGVKYSKKLLDQIKADPAGAAAGGEQKK